MATSKKQADEQKPVDPDTKLNQALAMKVVTVDIDTLKPHPKNARRGNLGVIKESLAANGQFRPIMVQEGTNYIVDGNHTWKAAKEIGWTKIKAVYLRVDDDAALRILIAANRASDLSTYDTEALADILAGLDQPWVGTGYTQDDVSAILAAIQEDEPDVEALTEAVRPTVDLMAGAPPVIEEQAQYDDGGAPALSDDDDTVFTPPDEQEDEADPFDNALGELHGAMALKVDMNLQGSNYYNIPELRSDMLLEELPENFDTWGGKDATPDDGMTHWLWNYGVASASGLPMDRATVCFYTYDEKFESWWDVPDFYVAKMLNSGVKSAVVPDFSFYASEPVAFHVYNAYRGQWMGRYFQECGLKVIPRLQFFNDASLDFALMGIPKGCPLLIHSAQNLESRGPGKPLTDMERSAAATINLALERIQPKTFIVYGGPPAHRLVSSGTIKSDHVENIVCLQNFAWKRRGVVFDKKEGLGSKGKSHTIRKKAKGDDKPDADDDGRSAEERELDAWGA